MKALLIVLLTFCLSKLCSYIYEYVACKALPGDVLLASPYEGF